MLVEFRSELHGILVGELPDVPVWDQIPDDVNAVPCVVVGRPSARRTDVAVVADVTCDVWAIGRRQEAGGSEAELTALTDDIFAALGGTRGTKSESGELYAVNRIEPRIVPIAGIDFPAYTVTVEASTATC